ncbi:hypothetical protein Micbo1qcDRAFT_206883 [Microdochium bolleyi]|uniref:C2H2-type domain-containing protein n=1 Tax=Microdochium bolleyi TaxID=196109 RepID=A0A136IUY6_9PEZI|nr:hypothetical protein Micbo1qcDRAFT_206883 [Microdochium bolleyi]
MVFNHEFECGTCGKEFPAGFNAREQHCDATGHARPDFECDTCHRWFNSRHACEQHMSALRHWDGDSHGWDCADCPQVFDNQDDMIQHEVNEHRYCDPCDRYFQRYSGLRDVNLFSPWPMPRHGPFSPPSHNLVTQHLKFANMHRSDSAECCFCRRIFVSARQITRHLESGTCGSAPWLSSDQIMRFVQTKDAGVFRSANTTSEPQVHSSSQVSSRDSDNDSESSQYQATGQNLNDEHGSSQVQAVGSSPHAGPETPWHEVMVLPADDVDWPAPCRYEATDLAWNGYEYECYVCHDLFTTVLGLNTHLNSPIRKCLFKSPYEEQRAEMGLCFPFLVYIQISNRFITVLKINAISISTASQHCWTISRARAADMCVSTTFSEGPMVSLKLATC